MLLKDYKVLQNALMGTQYSILLQESFDWSFSDLKNYVNYSLYHVELEKRKV